VQRRPETLMTADTYEIYAVCYAHHHRLARESFLDGDPHDESPMPLVSRSCSITEL
jgi:hypothetical protein